MTRNIIITACLSIVLVTSCIKDSSEPLASDYIIFGHFYGECKGEQCVEIYRLENDILFEDSSDRYPDSQNFYDGKWVDLSRDKFDAAKDLVNFFPADLLDEPGTVIGQPDAGDWGGLYIEYSLNETRRFWLLDQMKSNVPEKYHGFIDKVNEKIEKLQ
jgi:hypothetical protein